MYLITKLLIVCKIQNKLFLKVSFNIVEIAEKFSLVETNEKNTLFKFQSLLS